METNRELIVIKIDPVLSSIRNEFYENEVISPFDAIIALLDKWIEVSLLSNKLSLHVFFSLLNTVNPSLLLISFMISKLRSIIKLHWGTWPSSSTRYALSFRIRMRIRVTVWS